MQPFAAPTLDPTALGHWYRRNRERSAMLFDLLVERTYYSRPIALRHPIVFYDGHLAAFSFNTLVKRALGRPAIDEKLERLFARGIDPDTDDAQSADAQKLWPSRDVVRSFIEEVDRQVLDCLAHADLDRPGNHRAEAVFTILEHEAMHQETLLYMWHRLPFEEKRRPPDYRPVTEGQAPKAEWIHVPAGRATVGVDEGTIAFGWDNEFPSYAVDVPAFSVERHDVTNAAFLEFVGSGAYRDARWWSPDDWEWIQSSAVEHPLFWERDGAEWYWRGMFERYRLPLSWPVYVSHAEASAYTRWRGSRLLSEAEFQRAAFGTPQEHERLHPWGADEPSATRGLFDFTAWDPHPSGSHPLGKSAWGVEDLVGNGWEWTQTVFGPFEGFRPSPWYPEYSADFFDGNHFVLKGASTATARELLRPTFRNWFRPHYPYVYATFRCAKDDAR